MKRKLLIAVDLQKDFIDGVLGTREAQSILPAVRERLARARAEGETIVFTRDTHTKDYLKTQEGQNLPMEHCLYQTDGWQIADGLLEGERTFNKPAFGSTELAEYVRKEGFEQVELIGVCTDICVISNALILKAVLPQTPIAVRAHCCAGVSVQSHENALEAMRMCQIDIV